jgi:hypothetical protein
LPEFLFWRPAFGRRIFRRCFSGCAENCSISCDSGACACCFHYKDTSFLLQLTSRQSSSLMQLVLRCWFNCFWKCVAVVVPWMAECFFSTLFLNACSERVEEESKSSRIVIPSGVEGGQKKAPTLIPSGRSVRYREYLHPASRAG